ncbi:sirohydrochlorin chelatase [Gordonia sp. TBRC 11910]|uniref:Sirohydrochlorin chelatase n=1 Tax=Gordonia asplenii TaxID=2725283 RepID=A0A848KVX8_9ACTN|nr:sirohydrochlorin chelatase [Gordonia asplenii]NMN99617.1 sirohydrochlorin chelatase [Gordonia asplenii]
MGEACTLLVAHGTRNAHGVAMIGDLAASVAAALNEEVRVAFVDVLGPTPSDVLRMLDGRRVTLIPAFLSSGYHVRVDIPEHVAAVNHSDVTVTSALGPSPLLARVMLDRLIDAGWRPGDQVVLAAAGSSDPHAQSEVRTMATMLSSLVGTRVRIGFAAPPTSGGYPAVRDVVSSMRGQSRRRVAVASYLLADGLFQGRLEECGADVVGAPLGLHLSVTKLVCARRRAAVLV